MYHSILFLYIIFRILQGFSYGSFIRNWNLSSAMTGLIAGILLSTIFYFLLKIQRSKTTTDLIASAQNRLFSTPYFSIIILDNNKKIIWRNSVSKEIIGLPENIEYFGEYSNNQYSKLLEFIQQNWECLHQNKRIELNIENGDNSKELLVTMSRLNDKTNNKTIGRMITVSDITRLIALQKNEVWKDVIGKLAHEIKNPLSSVLLAAQKLQMEYLRDGVSHSGNYDKYIRHIKSETNRLHKITNELISFSKIGLPNISPCDINMIIQSSIASSKINLKDNISLELKLDYNLPQIGCDKEQLKLVFSNLIENAIYAIENEGCITIKSYVDLSGHEDINELAGKRKKYITILISDNGCGIPEKNLSKIFDPYFSTRKMGTGLGLAISRKIIEDHKGKILVDSNVSSGTTARIKLPVN